MYTDKISLDPSAITRLLALLTLLIVATSFGMQAYKLIAHQQDVTGLPMINLDGEHNLPALFSTGLLLSASVLLVVIAVLEGKRRAPDVSKWTILAAGFLLMAADEALSFHEKAIAPLRAMLGGQQLGIFFFAWVIPAIVLVAALGIFFLPFLFRLPRRTAIAFAISAAVYLGGALGVELVEGWWREGHTHRNLTYHALVSLEEGMEMIGVIGFIHALFAYIGTRYGEVRFAFAGAHVAATATPPATETALQPQTGP
jgi:hypothetical protein